MTVDTLEYVKRLEAAGVPRAQAEAHAVALRDEISAHLVTNADLGAAVDRLENKIETQVSRLEGKISSEISRLEGKISSEISRLEGKISSEISRLEIKIDANAVRVENTMWKVCFAMLGGGLAIGGLLIRFLR